jgi:hypothetical protein
MHALIETTWKAKNRRISPLANICLQTDIETYALYIDAGIDSWAP